MLNLLNAQLNYKTLSEIGFVPSALIVGGWISAFILMLACVYYAIKKAFINEKNK
jgi:hypothetical protein